MALVENTLRKPAADEGRRIHVNWFVRMDPQIADGYGRASLVAHRYRQALDAARLAGDEIGLHVHAWKKTTDGGWVADHADRAWVKYCVDSSWEAYAGAFGRKPRSFRFGDHFLDADVVRQIDWLGVTFDLTVEPGIAAIPGMRHDEAATGQLPDYTHFPRSPYRPARSDFGKRGRWFPRGLVLIPVSTGCVDGPDVAPAPGNGHQFEHLNLATDPTRAQHLFNRLRANRQDPIVWVARTGDYGFPEYQDNFATNLRLLAAHPDRAEFAFVRPDEALGMTRRPWLPFQSA